MLSREGLYKYLLLDVKNGWIYSSVMQTKNCLWLHSHAKDLAKSEQIYYKSTVMVLGQSGTNNNLLRKNGCVFQTIFFFKESLKRYVFTIRFIRRVVPHTLSVN
jgi:hypothetical protein